MWGIISTFITAAIHQAGDSSVKEVEWVFGDEGNPRKGEILGRRRWARLEVARSVTCHSHMGQVVSFRWAPLQQLSSVAGKEPALQPG